MRGKLLNDGGFFGLDSVKFPVEVEAEHYLGVGSFASVATSELNRVGAERDIFAEGTEWLFIIDEHIELIKDEPECNPDFHTLSN